MSVTGDAHGTVAPFPHRLDRAGKPILGLCWIHFFRGDVTR